MTRRALAVEVQSVLNGTHTNPHGFLGHHGRIARVWRPGASSVVVAGIKATTIDDAGLFEAKVADDVVAYTVEVAYPDGESFAYDDPYRHWPTLGELDVHLIGEGRHERLWEVLGAHCRVHEGVEGTAFAVWAPAARAVRVVGDFNLWDGRIHPMRQMGSSGVWELFVPGVGAGAKYKLEIVGADGSVRLKADPMAQGTEVPPGTSSIVVRSTYEWRDGDWVAERAARAATLLDQRLSIYEVHLGSWRRVPEDGGRSLTYRELAEQLPDYVADLGFTHVELLPVAEHPFGGSWGYQVSSYFAPTARFGSPDDFRALVDALHERGIGVIVDWVPAHFPKDAWALARFDGTALYEHADPRQGEQPDWGTLVFNYGRNEVRNFLVANALFWAEVLHIDGIRVDAVASMLYLDYSRKEGEWVPNEHGGRENLRAIAFLQELNTALHARCPGLLSIAEESTAFSGVSRPVADGGLGFTHKWNMGWMHDTLDYFAHETVHRRYHHGSLTFGLLYAFSENFVLPLSHDEVVHLKGSLLTKMPGDDWQRFANLRALLGWMWSHPGKQLLFMGGELAQRDEWSEARSIDWHLLDAPAHAGVQALVRELNRVEAAERALWACDFDGAGFQWIAADDADRSTLVFARHDPAGGSRSVVVVANLTPVTREGERIGLPVEGRWEELLNTDAAAFGGSGVGNGGAVETEPVAWHGQAQSALVTMAPLGVVYLAPI
ncbi:MAG: 1,4-alpha-glucan branching protein GlgB [Acidimicrobiales bacterium]